MVNVFHQNSDHTYVCYQLNESLEIVIKQIIHSLPEYSSLSVSECVMLLPGEQMTIMDVTLPKKLRKKEERQALLFALEEKLACDVNQIDMIAFPLNKTTQYTVIVFSSALLLQHLNDWKEAMCYPQVALPDYLALHWENDSWSVLIQKNRSLVRTDERHGFFVDTENLLTILKVKLFETNKKPLFIRVWTDSNELIEKLMTLGISIINAQTQEIYPFDWKTTLSKPPVNLLQGKYVVKRAIKPILSRQQIFYGSFLFGWILLLAIGFFIQFIYFDRQSAQLMLVHASLGKYQRIENNQQFFRLLSAVEYSLAHHSMILVNQLTYEHNELKIVINNTDKTIISNWINQLRKLHLTVSQLSDREIKISY